MPRKEYGAAARLFHRIALSGRATPELFFDIEKAMGARDCPDASGGAHVFVSGLARSGSTLLMRMLHDTNAFASLTYRDMPLVMAPNLWKNIAAPFQKQMARRERAHGDGLLVDYDSPEALEEVFWRTFCGPDYISADTLRPMQADNDVIADFRLYVAFILKRYERTRYLSKNNNSILRLSSLLAAFPNAFIIVPFREPTAHSASLLRQHERFIQIHAEDQFSRTYMAWLAHYEFGADQRRFAFNNADNKDYGDARHIAYWLDLWIDVYTHLIGQAGALGKRLIFFSYENLVAAPEAVRAGLFRRLELETFAPLEVCNGKTTEPAAPALARLEEAQALYREMNTRAISALTGD